MRIPYKSPADSAFKNHFMNGGFDIWQRETTFTSFEGKICDRFAVGYAITGARATWSREASIIPSNGLTQYSLKAQTSIIDAAPAAGALGLLRHRIEGNYFKALKGKTFFLKGKIYTNVTGDWTIGFSNDTEANRWLDQINVPVANTWTDFVLDVTHNPAIGTWQYGTNSGLTIAIPIIAGTNYQTSAANKRDWNHSTGWVITGSANQNFHSSLSNVIYLAQLQIVTDPDEEFSLMGVDLNGERSLCQRYYESFQSMSQKQGLASGVTTTFGNVFNMLQKKRVQVLPTIWYNGVQNNIRNSNTGDATGVTPSFGSYSDSWIGTWADTGGSSTTGILYTWETRVDADF